MAYLFLLLAIAFEVAGTTSLRLAIDDRRWYGGVAAGYKLNPVAKLDPVPR